MEIIAARVDSLSRWDNMPTLEILAEHVPAWEDFEWHNDGKNRWWAEKDGVFRYKTHSVDAPERPEGGYSNSAFTLNMADGTQAHLVGPWSSRTACFHDICPAMECRIYTNQTDWFEKKYCTTDAITFPRIEEALELCALIPELGHTYRWRLLLKWRGEWERILYLGKRSLPLILYASEEPCQSS